MPKRGLKTVKHRVGRLLSRMRRRTDFDINAINEVSAANLLDQSFQALCLSKNDPRARLEVIRRLPSHLVYFLASRQKKHDPLLVYPQAFVFQKTLLREDFSPDALFEHLISDTQPEDSPSQCDFGVPVFTAMPYLKAFANANKFSVFGPDGEDWVDGDACTEPQLLPVGEESDHKAPADVYAKAWPVCPSDVPVSPSFTGCFGEFSQIIEHFSMFPPAAQLVVNPSTHVEWSMPLSMAHRIGRHEEIGAKVYQEIAQKVSSELHCFFSGYCPEVSESYYWVYPRKTQAGVEYSTHSFVIAVGIVSACFASTYAKLREGRRSGAWSGHPSVLLKDIPAVSASLRKAATKFYVRQPVLTRDEGAFRTFSTIERWAPDVS